MARKQKEQKKNARPGASRDHKKEPNQSPASSRPHSDDASNNVGKEPGGEPDSVAAGTEQGSPAGLDADRHAAAQKRAHQVEVLRKGAFPALMAAALSIDPFFETGSYRLYLEQIKEDCGNPTDPIEVMLIEQLCLAHWRIAQLHVGAGHAKTISGTKMYNTVAARLLGEFRRTALALRVYQASSPKGKNQQRLKIFKQAQ